MIRNRIQELLTVVWMPVVVHFSGAHKRDVRKTSLDDAYGIKQSLVILVNPELARKYQIFLGKFESSDRIKRPAFVPRGGGNRNERKRTHFGRGRRKPTHQVRIGLVTAH